MLGLISHSRCAGATALLVLLATSGGAFADAAKGEIIAKRWCATCHLVSPEQRTANSDVPSFASIAHRKLSAEALTDFLSSPHHRMPDMDLTRTEIADIVAYIRSLDR